jgi:mRNA interferase MazF
MKMMGGRIMYERKDIILIPFPYPDLTESKKRPARIVSNSKLKGNDFICCLITSNNPKERLLIKKLATINNKFTKN